MRFLPIIRPLPSFRSSLVPLYRRLALCFICAAVASLAWSQNPGPASASPAPKTFAYEVVSIHPNNSPAQSSSWRSASNGIVLTNAPLSWLVQTAFDIRTDEQLSGLPHWVDSDRFDIQAKMDDESVAAWKKLSREEKGKQQQLLLQSLLTDRCQLKFHRETRQLPVYDLVVAKGGPKMKESASQSSSTSTSPGQFTALDAIVESLIYSLSGEVGHVVIDKTGLGDKKFDISLKWTPDEQRGTADAGPSIFTAIEDQLGLKLVASKGQVEVTVIDQMEKPEPN